MIPAIQCNQLVPTIQVGDIMTTVEFYVSRLGFRHNFFWGDPPVFAGVGLDKVTLHMQRHDSGTKGGQR